MAGRQSSAGRRLRVRLPEEFARQNHGVLRLRLGQIERDPGARPWLLRLITLRPADRSTGEARTAIGLIGFHASPDSAGRAEIGYRVFVPFRRRGYATEAVRGMLAWAARRHGVRTFVASIAPDNEPSMRLARGLGFRQVGAQIDDEDGLEFVYEVEWSTSSARAVRLRRFRAVKGPQGDRILTYGRCQPRTPVAGRFPVLRRPHRH